MMLCLFHDELQPSINIGVISCLTVRRNFCISSPCTLNYSSSQNLFLISYMRFTNPNTSTAVLAIISARDSSAITPEPLPVYPSFEQIPFHGESSTSTVPAIVVPAQGPTDLATTEAIHGTSTNYRYASAGENSSDYPVNSITYSYGATEEHSTGLPTIPSPYGRTDESTTTYPVTEYSSGSAGEYSTGLPTPPYPYGRTDESTTTYPATEYSYGSAAEYSTGLPTTPYPYTATDGSTTTYPGTSTDYQANSIQT